MIDSETVAERAARAGAEHAYSLFRRRLTVETKANKTDVVTRADREAQREVIRVIRDADPDATVVGEEEDARTAVPDSGTAWIVDPIDGTHNYVRGGRCWATSVCLVRDGDPRAAATVLPALGDSFRSVGTSVVRNDQPVTTSDRSDPERCVVCPTVWWPMDRREEYAAAVRAIVERFGDMKRPGSAQSALARLAAGELDGVLTNVETNPWDTVAGVHFVRLAGGRVTDLRGRAWSHDSTGLVASNGAVHEEVLAAARAISDP